MDCTRQHIARVEPQVTDRSSTLLIGWRFALPTRAIGTSFPGLSRRCHSPGLSEDRPAASRRHCNSPRGHFERGFSRTLAQGTCRHDRCTSRSATSRSRLALPASVAWVLGGQLLGEHGAAGERKLGVACSRRGKSAPRDRLRKPNEPKKAFGINGPKSSSRRFVPLALAGLICPLALAGLVCPLALAGLAGRACAADGFPGSHGPSR